jgi:GNAT superfamily N-acetyltransferase
MIIYRDAKPGDEQSIHQLINQLAVFELEPSAVINTPEALQRHLFIDKICFAIVAEKEDDREIIAFALYYFSYSTWKGVCLYLEDIYVQESYRKFKIGQTLFDRVVEKAKKNKVPRMDWQVLNWNHSAINFYKKNNAELSDQWLNGRLFFDYST